MVRLWLVGVMTAALSKLGGLNSLNQNGQDLRIYRMVVED